MAKWVHTGVHDNGLNTINFNAPVLTFGKPT